MLPAINSICDTYFNQALEIYMDEHYLETNFIKLPMPKGSWEKTGSFVYGSKRYDREQKLMIFIVAKAGVWSTWNFRNDDRFLNTQLPYLKQAKEKKYGIIITNAMDVRAANGKLIPDCGTFEEHVLYAWTQYVAKTKASSIVIVTVGAYEIATLSQKVRSDFEKRVGAIIVLGDHYTNFKVTRHIRKISRAWVRKKGSSLNEPIKTPKGQIKKVASGTKNEIELPLFVMESVFEFIDKKLIKFYLSHPYVEDNFIEIIEKSKTKGKNSGKSCSFNTVRDHMNDLTWLRSEQFYYYDN